MMGMRDSWWVGQDTEVSSSCYGISLCISRVDNMWLLFDVVNSKASFTQLIQLTGIWGNYMTNMICLSYYF